MKKLILSMIILGLASVFQVTGQTSPKEKGLQVIKKEVIQAQLEFLASDWTEGRATGEKGIYIAGDYVASMLKFSGIVPAGDPAPRRSRRGDGGSQPPEYTYFQNFTLLD